MDGHPQQIAKPGEHLTSGLRLLLDENGNVLERVEQEMWIEAHPQYFELGLAKVGLKP
jgi:hypothetical protein